jgi:hypothetical protein
MKYRLSSDQVWGVREAAVLILVQISEQSPMEVRKKTLVPIFKHFANDVSKFVKIAGFQQLGPFIATIDFTTEELTFKEDGFERETPGESQGTHIRQLLDFYISMADSKRRYNEEDIPFHCAFCFAGVLQTLGKQSWSYLEKAYINLVKINNIKVCVILSIFKHSIGQENISSINS